MVNDIDAIVFDAFGTLVTPVGGKSAYHALASAAGARPLEFRLAALTGNASISDLAAKYGLGHMAASLEEALATELSGCGLFEEAEGLLRHLSEDLGLRYAVCSNLAHGYGEHVRRLVPGAAAFVFSFEVGAAKPDPAIYRAVADALGAEPSRILFVGDTPKADVEGPRAFGMKAAHVDRRTGADLSVTTLRALQHYR